MKRFKNILYVAGETVTQSAAIERAVELAANNQAELTVIDVVPHAPEDLDRTTRARAEEYWLAKRRSSLDSLLAPYKRRLNCQIVTVAGKRFLEVLRAVLSNEHDLVITEAEDPDWSHRLFGSKDMHLLRKCPCPVWLTKPEEKPNYNCIVAAVDIDVWESNPEQQLLNEEILELASSLAVSDFASLHLVHAWDAPADWVFTAWADNPEKTTNDYVQGMRSRHRRAMAQLQAHLREHIGKDAYDYIAPQVHLPQGSPGVVIPELTKQLDADLVVMGTVGRSGIPGLLMGNTAETILDQLCCSVLVMKPPGFVSPVRSGVE
ncbi:universal stress protein [Litorivivens sp.]|uniref:universal stress protein n=1 Tax=Litorivivens sp. TaxID=2020868 RepID=UPI003562EB1B